MQEINYHYYMETDIGMYSGEWIAICNNEIVAHGLNVKEVAEEANRKCGGKKFLLARVPSQETMIF